MKKKRKLMIVDHDNTILLTYIALIFVGIFMQLNINSVRSDLSFFFKQAFWFILSFISLWISFKVISLEFLRKAIFPFLVLTLLLLIAVFFKSIIFPESAVNGSVRSIRILGINIQPSILARVVLVLFTANVLAKKSDRIDESTPKNFILDFSFMIIIIIIIYALILHERHFTPLVISSLTLLWMLILAKIRYSTVISIIFLVSIAGFLVLNFGPDYRGNRMNIFRKYSLTHKALNIDSDSPVSNDYQVRESLIALASGGLLGRGPTHGLAKHYFLPEAKTDYVFAIIGEDFGLWGSLLIIIAYCAIFWRAFINSRREKDLFLKLAGIGLGLNLFINAMVNIGVAISALPATGVTLPFISYGGTSLLINSVTIGLLLNISATRRRVI
jgi:cell division protein FtsW